MKFLLSGFAFCMFMISCSNDDNDINNQDTYFMQQASYSNLAEIGAGSIAETHGDYDSVSMFGSMMVTDHGPAQDELESLAASVGVSIPSAPDSAHLAMAAHLDTLSGYVFDTTYIGAQVSDHLATIAVFQQELSAGNNQQAINYANKYLPVIQMHLAEAQRIRQQIQ